MVVKNQGLVCWYRGPYRLPDGLVWYAFMPFHARSILTQQREGEGEQEIGKKRGIKREGGRVKDSWQRLVEGRKGVWRGRRRAPPLFHLKQGSRGAPFFDFEEFKWTWQSYCWLRLIFPKLKKKPPWSSIDLYKLYTTCPPSHHLYLSSSLS